MNEKSEFHLTFVVSRHFYFLAAATYKYIAENSFCQDGSGFIFICGQCIKTWAEYH